ncbi:MAG: hypothetical protein CMP27_00260 [Roseibacillus sp.]|nr:hypothetical protein [Roseibacillus sp.]
MAICNFEFDVNGLDSDVLEVLEFSGEEEISRLFRFELDLLSTDKELDFSEIVNKPATLSVQRNPGGEESFFRGLVVDFQQYGETRDKARYRVTLMPRTWRLSYTYQSCVFQDKTVETIIGDVLAEHGFSQGDIRFELIGDYAERDFCVQYRETDLDFICRLMEYEGMYFYFDHSQEQEVMIISDDRSNEVSIRDDQDSVVGYHQPEGLLPLDDVETINEFVYKEQIVTGKVILKDYNYRESEVSLQGEATLNPEMPGMFYSYGSHFKDNDQGNRLAQVRNQEFECQRRTAEGRSNCISLRGGYKMGLQGHYREDLNADYLLIRVQHQGQMIEGQGSYNNAFTCIPSEVQYRPERRTPEPRLPGILTAKVEGSDDNSQYASIDEMGRYKVRLPFDQGDESLGNASKPIRLMQPSTGAGHGMHFPVHAGAEMIWACIDGNVDRPIGLGTAPNSTHVSPVTSENNNENLLQTSSGHRLSMDDNTENPTLTLSSMITAEGSSVSGGYCGGTGKGSSQSSNQGTEDDVATALSTPQQEGNSVVRQGGMANIEEGVAIDGNTITMESSGIAIDTTSESGLIIANNPKNEAILNTKFLQLTSGSETGVRGPGDFAGLQIPSGDVAGLLMSGTTKHIQLQTPSTQEILALGSGTGTGTGGITIGTKNNANTTIHGHSLVLAGITNDYDKLVIDDYSSAANAIIGYVNAGIATIIWLRGLYSKFKDTWNAGIKTRNLYGFLKLMWSFVGAYKTLEGPISGAVDDDNYKSLAAGLDWTSKTTGSTTILGDDAINLLAPEGSVLLNANGIALKSTSSTSITNGYMGVSISTMALGISLSALQGGITLSSSSPLDDISLDNAFGGVKISGCYGVPHAVGGGVTLAAAPAGVLPQAAPTKITLDHQGIQMISVQDVKLTIDEKDIKIKEQSVAVTKMEADVKKQEDAISNNSNAIADNEQNIIGLQRATMKRRNAVVSMEEAGITSTS